MKTARLVTQTVIVICPECDELIANPDFGYSFNWDSEALNKMNFVRCSCGSKVRLPKTISLA